MAQIKIVVPLDQRVQLNAELSHLISEREVKFKSGRYVECGSNSARGGLSLRLGSVSIDDSYDVVCETHLSLHSGEASEMPDVFFEVTLEVKDQIAIDVLTVLNCALKRFVSTDQTVPILEKWNERRPKVVKPNKRKARRVAARRATRKA